MANLREMPAPQPERMDDPKKLFEAEVTKVEQGLQALVSNSGEVYHNAQIIREDLEKIKAKSSVVNAKGYELACTWDKKDEFGEIRVDATTKDGLEVLLYKTSPNGYHPSDSEKLNEQLIHLSPAKKAPAIKPHPGDLKQKAA